MKKVFAKSLLVAAMFSVAGSALAVQKDITVTANVDAALDMTQTDNTALPKAVEIRDGRRWAFIGPTLTAMLVQPTAERAITP